MQESVIQEKEVNVVEKPLAERIGWPDLYWRGTGNGGISDCRILKEMISYTGKRIRDPYGRCVFHFGLTGREGDDPSDPLISA